MTEQTQVSDIASMLLAEGDSPDPDNETTGATEIQEIIESNSEEADDFELEAETDGIEEEAEVEASSDGTEWVDVESDGEALQVTPKEKDQGYLRDSDYRKKTMSLAASRKDVEAKAASIDAKLVELDSFIKREEDNTDWAQLEKDDPTEFIRRERQLKETKAVAETAKADRNVEIATQAQELANVESSKLIEVMGGDTWTGEQRNADMKAASEYLSALGLTQEQISGITSHVMWKIIFDGSKANGIQKTKSQVIEQVRKAPKSVKPGQSLPASERNRRAANKRIANAPHGHQVDALADLLSLE